MIVPSEVVYIGMLAVGGAMGERPSVPIAMALGE